MILDQEDENMGVCTELAAVDKAIGIETTSYDYYVNRSKKAECNAEKEFYEAAATVFHMHRMTLLDYLEYLSDPASWFVKTEHPSFD